jgi:DNA-binding transcriptional LysR family regulator
MKRYLDDILLFIAVADAGGLSAAAAATGQSAPTLSRRMVALERQLSTRLFERGKRGFVLTTAGRALLEEAASLRDTATRLERWAARDTAPRVRISAGFWTAQFLARHITRIWSPKEHWVPAFLASNARLDISRREADIGIRNQRPEQSWLATRRTARVHYAEYASHAGITGYIALSGARTPSARWLAAQHGEAITTTASDPHLAMELASSGIGRVVLPCFAGEQAPGLVRVSSPIEALAHDEWLTAHHDARHDPPVRAALDALARLLTDDRLRPLPSLHSTAPLEPVAPSP